MIVKNRSAGIVGYTIPDLNIKRRFVAGEAKNISKEELEKLAYQPGGAYLLANYLQVSAEDVKTLDIETEREYFFSEADIKKLMTEDSLDAFLDALDFAPEGVIDMIKDYAVKLPLKDTDKIDALKKKTGFDAHAALANQKATEQEDAPVVTERKRRVEEKPKYNVVG